MLVRAPQHTTHATDGVAHPEPRPSDPCSDRYSSAPLLASCYPPRLQPYYLPSLNPPRADAIRDRYSSTPLYFNCYLLRPVRSWPPHLPLLVPPHAQQSDRDSSIPRYFHFYSQRLRARLICRYATHRTLHTTSLCRYSHPRHPAATHLRRFTNCYSPVRATRANIIYNRGEMLRTPRHRPTRATPRRTRDAASHCIAQAPSGATGPPLRRGGPTPSGVW